MRGGRVHWRHWMTSCTWPGRAHCSLTSTTSPPRSLYAVVSPSPASIALYSTSSPSAQVHYADVALWSANYRCEYVHLEYIHIFLAAHWPGQVPARPRVQTSRDWLSALLAPEQLFAIIYLYKVHDSHANKNNPLSPGHTAFRVLTAS